MTEFYHIVPHDSQYKSRVVICNETEDHHKYHERHMEQFIVAVCGDKLIRYKDAYCNAGIADHVYMNSSRNWCAGCVANNNWLPATIDELRTAGYTI